MKTITFDPDRMRFTIMRIQPTTKFDKACRYIRRKPGTIFSALGYIFFFASFFSDWLGKYFFIIILCFAVGYLLEKQYKNMFIMIAIYSVFWIIRVFIGGFWSFMLFTGVCLYMLYMISTKFGSIFKDAERDKDEFIFNVLTKLQKNDTPYMRELRDKLGKGKN